MRKPLFWIVWTVALTWLIPAPAFAYLDPGTGSMLVSALIGIAATVFFLLKSFFYKGANLFYRLSGKTAPKDAGAIVFYGEARQYWNTFRPVLEALDRAGIKAAYLCSDPDDPGLTHPFTHITTRHIGQGNRAFAALNMLEADICVLTTPGLDVLQIQRSPGVKHYAHIVHSITDMAFYKIYAFDYFDSVFCAGPHQMRSLRHLENLRGTTPKRLLESGCPYMDVFAETLDKTAEQPAEEQRHAAPPPASTHAYADSRVARPATASEQNKTLPRILIAPTWGRNGLLFRFGSGSIIPLAEEGYEICLRPHPQSFRSEPDLIERLKRELAPYPHVTWDSGASALEAMRASDILISDLSGIVFDYAFILERPVITLQFTPDTRGMDAADLPWPAWELEILPALGAHVSPDSITRLPEIIAGLPLPEEFRAHMRRLRGQSMYNFRNSGSVIAAQLQEIYHELNRDAASNSM